MIMVHLLWGGLVVFLISFSFILDYYGGNVWLIKLNMFVGFVLTVVYGVLLRLH
jgi:hypothetical protein